MKYNIIKIQEESELKEAAANWFHSKWGVPKEAYLESMEDCIAGGAVPQWYVVMEGESIIAGLGVIENDFHDRKELTPNVCAVYVEDAYRRQGIASSLTSRLAVEILNRGKVPFYCAAWSNIKSVRNAIRSGFRPAWVEMTAKPCEMVDAMNEK